MRWIEISSYLDGDAMLEMTWLPAELGLSPVMAGLDPASRKLFPCQAGLPPSDNKRKHGDHAMPIRIALLLPIFAAVTPALAQPAAGFHQLTIHDKCIGENTAQPDTCLHLRHHEKSFTFGGKPGTVYDVTLRVRGLFEPTTIEGGDTPDPAHPFFKTGGTVTRPD